MAKKRDQKTSVYLADATCNASSGAGQFFMDKSYSVAIILLQKVGTTYSAFSGTTCPREVRPWGALQ